MFFFKKAKRLINNHIHKKNNRHELKLLSAIESDNLDQITKALKHVDINARNHSGNTILMQVVGTDLLDDGPENPDTISFLIERGTNLNAVNKDGNTALILAVKAYRFEFVQLLLKANVDVNIKNKEGDTALIIAKKNRNELRNLFKNCDYYSEDQPFFLKIMAFDKEQAEKIYSILEETAATKNTYDNLCIFYDDRPQNGQLNLPHSKQKFESINYKK